MSILSERILSQRMGSIFPLNRKTDENDIYLKERVQPYQYHEKLNPKGVINLAIAWSYVCDDIVSERLKKVQLDDAHIGGTYYGTQLFRQSMANFYTRELSPKNPIDPENIIVTNGLTSTMDMLGHILADPGEVFCTPTPTYAYFSRNFFIRAEIELWPIDLLSKKPNCPIEHRFDLTAEKVEEGIKAAIKKGKVVRGFVLSNPSNPFGTIYSEALVLEILQVCAKYKIHAIIDECSHLCVHKTGAKFRSVVAFDRIPDPKRTHVLWTLTKDLSLGGARISTVYSYNAEVANCLRIYSPFYVTSPFQQKVCRDIVEDQKWCHEIYFPAFLNGLRDAYELICERLVKLGAFVHPSECGLVLMVSFRKFLKSDTFNGEIDLLNQFVKHGVYLLPGQFIFCTQPGWFRIAFGFPRHLIELGLDRIEEALSNYNGTDLNVQFAKLKSKF